jgi:pimeloyl-ACP methyl ester carboxylesterase
MLAILSTGRPFCRTLCTGRASETDVVLGQLAAKVWSPAPGAEVRGSVLALHGWMDNAGSFDALAPVLASVGYRVAALDLAGHGHSPHRPAGAGYGYNYMDQSLAVLEAAQALEWPRLTLLGHSMGAGIATLVGGALATAAVPAAADGQGGGLAAGAGGESFEPGNRRQRPQAVAAVSLPALDGVVLVEGLGVVSRPDAAAPSNVLDHLRSRARLERRKLAGAPRVYEGAEAAVAARVRTVASHPGEQWLSEEGARALVARGSTAAAAAAVVGGGGRRGGGVSFTHDASVVATHPFWLTEDQACAFLEALGGARTPVLCFRAEHGWPFSSGVWEAREQRLRSSYGGGGLGQELVELEFVPNASHHLHLDPETAPAVAARVVTFLDRLAAHSEGAD